MAARKARKALFIDDAFARPTVSDFQKKISSLRKFLTDNPKTKSWFDQEFNLSGNHSARTYFDPMLSPETILRFWGVRNKSPSKSALVKQVFADLSSDLSQHHTPLEIIEKILKKRGWTVSKMSTLPSLEEVDESVSIIVIDYLLSNTIPEDVDAKVLESIEFLKLVVSRAKLLPGAVHPFVFLISSLPSAVEHAHTFRSSSSMPGGLFRFVGKISAETDFASAIDTFIAQEDELIRFRKVHVSLEAAVASAAQDLLERVVGLELEDIATLYTGQLVTEKEPLSDYLGWLSGQLLAASIQRNTRLAETSTDLPLESYNVLLGHCEPTQNLSRLFSDFSSVKTSSGEIYKGKHKVRQVRFGDLFVKKKHKKTSDSPLESLEEEVVNSYYMVISQTCDLLQGKIANGEVLCVQGVGRVIKSTEVELLRVTVKQMFSEGEVLVRDGDQFIQIEWGDAKSLVTHKQLVLSKESNLSYVGRLNEIYALEVQHKALHQLGRIGVPIVPGYRVFFGGAELRVFNAKGELSQFHSCLNNSSVLAVLRCDKTRQKLLFSSELRNWLISKIEEISSVEGFPTGLSKNSSDLLRVLKLSKIFNVNVKFSRDGKIESFQREPVLALGEERPVSIPGGIEFLLDGLPRSEKQPASVRIQIKFMPFMKFHKKTLSL